MWINRGYYKVAGRYEFYILVQILYLTSELLTTVMTRTVVDKSTHHAKSHSIC